LGKASPAMNAGPTISIDVSGNVTDANGEALIGVNIQVKGTAQGTSTDFDGRFALENVPEDAVLVFSYIGYQTLEVPVDGQTTISVVLQEDSQTLEEVVVVGYGTVKKRSRSEERRVGREWRPGR